uniref:C-type lectin domain-containing protein n=1 Tax=Scylla olivacea TaxID=85551 RepID=A0A0P4WGZ1_SCYOL
MLWLQVNVWDRVLAAGEIQRMARCEDDPQGNYVSWEVGWTLQEVTSYEASLDDFCKDKFDMTYWFPSLTHVESQYLCPSMGSRHPSATDRQEILALVDKAQAKFPPSHSCYADQWLNITDIQEEGVWRDGKTPVRGDIMWKKQEPNGIQYENCVSINGRGGLDDVNCNTNAKCVICFFEGPKRFSLLGTCELELRNVYFMVVQPDVGELQFLGYGAYKIMLQEEVWVWLDSVTNHTIATMVNTNLDFPMGRRWWKLERSVCGQKAGGLRRLLLSPCPPGHFTCDDATCIAMDHRCDFKHDCRDKSDELGCEVVSFPEDYQNHLPPRLEQEGGGVSLPITLTVGVESLGVNTLAMTLEVSYTLSLTWVDNRLLYRNLKHNSNLNVLSLATVRLLWAPEVAFVNTVDGHHTKMDYETNVRVNRLANAVERNSSSPAEGKH